MLIRKTPSAVVPARKGRTRRLSVSGEGVLCSRQRMKRVGCGMGSWGVFESLHERAPAAKTSIATSSPSIRRAMPRSSL
jgi:hypothetical protein